MNRPLYIHAATAISPQQSFEREGFLAPLITSDTNRLYALEAPYAKYISPVAIRRMSRIMKMTISAGMRCLEEAGLKTPDAIITGTGRGGVADMETFVKDMIRLDEEALNPTTFIQSTYNSPNGWIAMQSGCTGYNQTYVHRGCSFELALQDAQMLLSEAAAPMRLLVGCYDEMTEEYFIIRGKRGYWKKAEINSGELFRHEHSPGTIGGEGAAFFVVSNQQQHATSCIRATSIIHNATEEALAASVSNMLHDHGLKPEDISLVLTGLNGDSTQSGIYTLTLKKLLHNVPVAGFKHLCGEYDTAGGFGLWLCNEIMHTGTVPAAVMLQNHAPADIKNVLILNHYILGSASIALICNSLTPLNNALTAINE